VAVGAGVGSIGTGVGDGLWEAGASLAGGELGLADGAADVQAASTRVTATKTAARNRTNVTGRIEFLCGLVVPMRRTTADPVAPDALTVGGTTDGGGGQIFGPGLNVRTVAERSAPGG
jgi:hypothetical protein